MSWCPDLRLTLQKSNFVAIGVVGRYAELLNCKQLSIPFDYLGIPIGANPRREITWRKVIDKFQSRLSLWKHKTLSLVGRVCPINLVLTSLPLFFVFF